MLAIIVLIDDVDRRSAFPLIFGLSGLKGGL